MEDVIYTQIHYSENLILGKIGTKISNFQTFLKKFQTKTTNSIFSFFLRLINILAKQSLQTHQIR